MVDGICSDWNVDSSVRLSRNIKIVLLELWIFFVPGRNGSEVVSSDGVIVVAAVLWIINRVTVRVTNTSWLFNVEHIGKLIPGMLIFIESRVKVRLKEWTVLLSPCKHGRASWSTVEPDDEWIIDWIVLTCNEQIMNLL